MKFNNSPNSFNTKTKIKERVEIQMFNTHKNEIDQNEREIVIDESVQQFLNNEKFMRFAHRIALQSISMSQEEFELLDDNSIEYNHYWSSYSELTSSIIFEIGLKMRYYP